MPKAMLIRIGNDENCDKEIIMDDSAFDFVPIQEEDTNLIDSISYDSIKSRVHQGKYLSDIYPKLKEKLCHLDPYFPDYHKHKHYSNPTYCDPGAIKSEFLKTLDKGDLVVFYWGIKQNNKKELFIIGYLYADKIADLNLLGNKDLEILRDNYFSAHLYRKSPGGVLVIGSGGGLLKKPICFTQGIKKGSTNYVVKEEYAELFGINEMQSGSYYVKVLIQEEFVNLKNLITDRS